jgi:SAM-dependent methyltransferase
MAAGAELYDRIGTSYSATRRADGRIAAAIHAALGDARTVVNVGAGTGNYEPLDRELTAVEPSETMIAQRPRGAARVVRAHAEALPFADASFDAAMSVLSDHHWSDRRAGLRELRRVGRRAVVFTWDPASVDAGWLVRDYLAGFRALPGMALEEIASCLGGARVEPVAIPHDCADGFLHAFWRRPEAYLDARVRDGISVFSRLDPADVDEAIGRLARDLRTGAWRRRNADLLDLPELDLGYRLLVAPADAPAGPSAPG